MPDKWPLANGNWSNAANWNGGTKPLPGDDVFADGRTVNVDESFTVLSLRNTQRSGGTLGGTFVLNGGITVVANGSGFVVAASSTLLSSAVSSPNIVTLSGNVNNFVNNAITLSHTGTGTINIIGNVTATSNTNSGNTTATISFTNGVLNITGSLTTDSSNSTWSRCINIATATVNVLGNLTIPGHVSGGGWTKIVINGTNSTINVVGDVTSFRGNGSDASAAISLNGGTVNIRGTVAPINFGVAHSAISLASGTDLNIIGDLLAGTVCPTITTTTLSNLNISGSITSTSPNPAVVSTNASATNIFTGPFINTNNTMAVQCVDMVLTQDASTFWNFGDITLYSPEQLAYYPSASDIRQGTTYADGTVSGSLAMPPPTAVIAGTPTDNTTGSAVLTPEQLQDAFWGAPLSQMTETGSIGYRLAKSATTDSTGNQIASYLI